MKSAPIFLLFGALAFAAKKPAAWEDATVVSQKFDYAKLAARFTRAGNGWASTTIRVHVSLVEIDTGRFRYTLMEAYGKDSRVLKRPYSTSPLILAVNGSVQFYRDGDWLVFMGGKKKHSFSVIGTEPKPALPGAQI